MEWIKRFHAQQRCKTMLNYTQFGRTISYLALVFLFCAPAYAQQEADRTRGTREPGRNNYGVEEAADFAQENLGRVAASATQIRTVLVKDEGLLVELKRWVAKEATDNGQVVDDSMLTDQAIFDRLEQDVTFRSIATRLLQRYGYLIPSLNPDSDFAKEKELVLKERARRLVQIEAQEDSESLRQQKNDGDLERTATCDPRRDDDCAHQLPTDRRQKTRARGVMPSPEANPQRAPEQVSPQTPSRILQAEGSPQDAEQPDGANSSSDLELISSPAKRDSDSYAGSQSLGQGANDGLTLGRSVPSMPLERDGAGEVVADKSGMETRARVPRGRTNEEDMTPVRMVHRANPYADIPSLYDMYVQASAHQRPTERFGLEVFRNTANDPEAIPMDLPVGPSYVVGPGDSLSIDLWGGVSQRLPRTVDREGRVALPEVGPVLVAGRTLGEAQEIVQRALRTQFRDVSADVSLLRLRSVRVYVVGDVISPGAYDVSSLSTPLNALFVAGGVTPQGSLRRLQHYRGKQLIEEVDAYDLLLHGIRGDLQRIENGDSLMVPPLGPVVTVGGMVRRPAVYELHSEKTLLEVLDLSGGILPAAALRHIEVQRLVAHEKRTMLSVEISDTSDSEAVRAQMGGFEVQDGDEIHIFPIAPYNSASIYLQGHVLRPGRYSYKPEMKLTDLVSSYADLLPEPSVRYAEIIRLHAPDYHPVVETFDLAAALEHPEKAPKLEPLDTVRIFGRYDFEPDPEVLVTGEVRAPGRYRTSGQQHLRDAIFQAGGVTPDAWLDSGQLFRRQPDGTTRVFSINLNDALAGDPLNNILVQPRDRILVHRHPEQVSPASVYVRGDVARPGRYPLAANMRISDLVQSAGGLLRSANPDAGDLTHYAISNSSGERVQAGHQDLNLAAALAGKEDQNLPLHDGDVLTVPQQANWSDIGAVVSVRGEVHRPGVYGIRPGERLSSLLKRAGGLLPTAYPRAAVFERNEVRELQQRSRQELIQRLEQESTVVKTSASTTGTEEAALQQAAVQQRQRTLEALRKAPVSGRLVIHLRSDRKDFAGSPDDIELRAGDSLTIPKQPGSVLVIGQVYNSNALTFAPGRNAAWYLSRSGGPTPLANKGEIFIIRSDGSVTGGKQGGFWSGSVLSSTIGPGDTVIVPERPVLGSGTLKNVLSIAQIASSAALVAAVAIP